MLSRNQIAKNIANGSITIQPFYPTCLGPNSYDLHLSEIIYEYDPQKSGPINIQNLPDISKWNVIHLDDNGYELDPDKLYLGSTVEYTETFGFVPVMEGKSSSARIGISPHHGAGFGDNGFCGHWTLEIIPQVPVIIYPGVRIAQVCFHETNVFEKDEDSFYNKRKQSNYNNLKEKVSSPVLALKPFKSLKDDKKLSFNEESVANIEIRLLDYKEFINNTYILYMNDKEFFNKNKDIVSTKISCYKNQNMIDEANLIIPNNMVMDFCRYIKMNGDRQYNLKIIDINFIGLDVGELLKEKECDQNYLLQEYN